MSTTTTRERQRRIEEAQSEAARWSRYVDKLLEAFDVRQDAPRSLTGRMEALRNKRDSVVTKVEALKRHRDHRWSRAQEELEEARRELRDSWRIVISTLDKERLLA